MRTDNAADIRLNAMLGNCIFYISPMYEFSHSLGHKRTHAVLQIAFTAGHSTAPNHEWPSALVCAIRAGDNYPSSRRDEKYPRI
jgi:hypothetical protein